MSCFANSVSLGVPPYDPHDAASVPATAEFRVQTVCVQSIRDGLESDSLGTLDSDASDDLLFTFQRYILVADR
jgi:hypothetical protein